MIYKTCLDFRLYFSFSFPGGSGSWLIYTMIPFALHTLDEMEATGPLRTYTSLEYVCHDMLTRKTFERHGYAVGRTSAVSRRFAAGLHYVVN